MSEEKYPNGYYEICNLDGCTKIALDEDAPEVKLVRSPNPPTEEEMAKYIEKDKEMEKSGKVWVLNLRDEDEQR